MQNRKKCQIIYDFGRNRVRQSCQSFVCISLGFVVSTRLIRAVFIILIHEIIHTSSGVQYINRFTVITYF